MITTEPWALVEEGAALDPAHISKHETLFFVGNGLVGARGTLEEYNQWGSVVASTQTHKNNATQAQQRQGRQDHPLDLHGGGDIPTPPNVDSISLQSPPLVTVSPTTAHPSTFVSDDGPLLNLPKLGLTPPPQHQTHQSSTSNPIDSNDLSGSLPLQRHSQSFIEAAPKSAPSAVAPTQRATFLNGIYDERPVQYPHKEFSFGSCHTESYIVGVPDATNIDIYVGEEQFGFTKGTMVSHKRTLDYRTCALIRKGVWESSTGKQIDVTMTRLSLFCHAKAMVMRVSVKPLNFSSQREIRVVSRLTMPTPSSMAPSTDGNNDGGGTETPIFSPSMSASFLPHVDYSHQNVTRSIGGENDEAAPRRDLHCRSVKCRDSNDGFANAHLHARTSRSHIDVVCSTRQQCTIVHKPQMVKKKSSPNSSPNQYPSSSTAATAGATTGSGIGGRTGASPLHRDPTFPQTVVPSSSSQFQSPNTLLEMPLPSSNAMPDSNPAPPAAPKHMRTNSTSSGQAATTPSRPPPAPSPSHPLKTTRVIPVSSVDDREHAVATSFSTAIETGEELVLDKFVVYYTSKDDVVEELHELSTHILDTIQAQGFEALIQEQEQFVDTFWQDADLQVVCDDDSSIQGTLRFNMVQLLMSAGRTSGTNFGIKGLTSANFGGRYTWDTEIFIFPFFVYSHLPVAKAMIQFRIDTLPEALDRAMDLELTRGAVYPWQTISGIESTLSSISCTTQLHINADIAYAIKQYLNVTNDMELMRNGGAAVVFTTALVWIQWGTWDKGLFHLRHVTGPDEYNVLVHDNCYTNLMAQHHLLFAADLAKRLQEQYPDDWTQLQLNYMIEDEDISAMLNAAEKMCVPYDGNKKIHLQDEGFLRKKEWTRQMKRAMSSQRSTMDEFHPLTIYRHRVCKQADVILSQVLLGHRFTRDEKLKNFEFYERITTHDSSLTSSTFGIMAAELGLCEKAYYYFMQSLRVDVQNVIGNTGAGIHAASMAGSWSCVVLGFGGLRNVDGTLHFNPWLPDGWQEYRFSVKHGGTSIKVVVGRRMVTYSAGENDRIRIVHAGSTRVHLAKGKAVSVKLLRDIRSFEFDAVVFDINTLVNHVQEDHYDAWRAVLEPVFAAKADKEGDTDPKARELSMEQYLAYVRHHPHLSGKKYTGLQKLLSIKGVNLPLGDPVSDTEADDTIYGLIARKLQTFRGIVSGRGRLGLVDGAAQLIQDLRQNGIAVGCVSSSHNGHWMLRQSPIFSQVDYFVDSRAGDDLGLDFKPEGRYFNHCAGRLDATPERTVVILDSVLGFSRQGLQQFGLVLTTEATDEQHTRSDLQAAGADEVLMNLNINADDLDGLFDTAAQKRSPQMHPVSSSSGPSVPFGGLGGSNATAVGGTSASGAVGGAIGGPVGGTGNMTMRHSSNDMMGTALRSNS